MGIGFSNFDKIIANILVFSITVACCVVHTTEGPLLTLFFETLEKQPCKQRSDLVLNGQMRVPK